MRRRGRSSKKYYRAISRCGIQYGLLLAARASCGEPAGATGAGHTGEKGWPSDGTEFSKEAAGCAEAELSAAGLLALAADVVAAGAAPSAGASSARAGRHTPGNVNRQSRQRAAGQELSRVRSSSCRCPAADADAVTHGHGAPKYTSKKAARQRTVGRANERRRPGRGLPEARQHVALLGARWFASDRRVVWLPMRAVADGMGRRASGAALAVTNLRRPPGSTPRALRP